LTYGSVIYGVLFLCAIPCWLRLEGVVEEDPDVYCSETRSVLVPQAILVNVLAALLDAALLELNRAFVAPLVTTVEPNRSPFGKCLENF
jgi:hypothetical protein